MCAHMCAHLCTQACQSQGNFSHSPEKSTRRACELQHLGMAMTVRVAVVSAEVDSKQPPLLPGTFYCGGPQPSSLDCNPSACEEWRRAQAETGFLSNPGRRSLSLAMIAKSQALPCPALPWEATEEQETFLHL